MKSNALAYSVLVLACFSTRPAGAASLADFVDFSLRSGTTTLLPGRLYVPPVALTDPSTPRPFILFLHGAGESGTNNSAQVNGNIDNLLAEAKRRNAFLYAPQTNGGWEHARDVSVALRSYDGGPGACCVDLRNARDSYPRRQD